MLTNRLPLEVSILEIVLSVAVPLCAALYAAGDYAGWWDHLSGRKHLMAAYRRLSSGMGFPVSFIYEDEAEFKTLVHFLIARTENEEVVHNIKTGQGPSLVTFGFAGGLSAPQPETWPTRRFFPDTSPVLLCWGVSKGQASASGKATWACTVGDLRLWIDQHRQTERFVVTVSLIGVLSVLVAVLYAG